MVVTVLNATCLLFGFEENWENAKRHLLGDIRILEKMIEFDALNCPENRFIKLRNNYLNKEDFKREFVIK